MSPANAPSHPGLQSPIDKAKADLAQRFSISSNEIKFVEIKEVDWPDSSLGGPRPGMAYMQVITPGHIILLEYNNLVFEYHANRNIAIVFCQSQFHPIPGRTANPWANQKILQAGSYSASL